MIKRKDGLKMSRRHFLGVTLAGSALGLTGCGSGGAMDHDLTYKGVDYNKPRAGEWRKSFCGSCIWTNCGTEVKIQNGVAIEIRGNKVHPSNKGTLCTRGAAMLMNTYNPYRVKKPMKRTNPNKGLEVDPGWVEISWKEAMDTIVEKIKTAQTIDPRKLMIMYGFSANLHETTFVKTFLQTFNTPNYAMSCGPLCEVHHAPAIFHATFVDKADFGYCDYVVAFGRNLGTSAMFASGPGRALADAVSRGMKVVAVDPHSAPDVSKGGEWVPILPGADMPMGMAMLRRIIETQGYDLDCLKHRTNAPYLVYDDDTTAADYGHYVRDSSVYPDPATNPDWPQEFVGKPMMMDSDGVIKAFDDTTLTDPLIEVLPGTTYKGRVVNTGFTKIWESVDSMTSQRASTLCGVPAETIDRVTDELIDASNAKTGETITIEGKTMPLRPAMVTVGRGSANNIQGMRFYILADIINMMLGAIGVPGSLLTAANPRFVFEDGIMREYTLPHYTSWKEAAFTIPANDFTGKQFYPLARFPILGATMKAINNPADYHLDYDIDVFFPYGCNPFINDADKETTVKAFQKIPFIFTLAYHLDETAMFCDIVLPEPSHYERHQLRPLEETMIVGKDTISIAGINYKEPAIDKLYDTRQFDDIIIEITDRLGYTARRNTWYNLLNRMVGTPFALDPDTQYTYEEMMLRRIQTYFNDSSLTLDYMRQHGFKEKTLPVEDCYEYLKFNGKGRIPIYNWRDFMAGKSLRRAMERESTRLGKSITIPGWSDHEDALYEYTPVPLHRDNFLIDEAGEYTEYDMLVANWKTSTRALGIGGQDDNVWLREMAEMWEYDRFDIQINSKTAIAKGLKTGDKVLIESQHGGALEGVIRVTELIRPDVLGFPAQGGRTSTMFNPAFRNQGYNYNSLLSYDEGFIMGDNGSICVTARVKVKKINN